MISLVCNGDLFTRVFVDDIVNVAVFIWGLGVVNVVGSVFDKVLGFLAWVVEAVVILTISVDVFSFANNVVPLVLVKA